MGSAAPVLEQVEQASGRVRILVGGNHGSLVRSPEALPLDEALHTHEQESTLLFERLAYEGTLALDSLKIEHPEWFKPDLEYPAEDTSIPDLTDVEIDDLE